MVNDALHANPTQQGKTAAVALTTHGSDWYWAVCAVMTCSTFVFLGLALTKPRTQRIFHYITAAITMVASIAYFTMGSHLGWTAIQVEFNRASSPEVRGQAREIYYVRYIDWVITTPLLLLDLLLTAAMPTPSILWTILIDEVMIITGLVGALVRSSYKWGYYTFGCFALFMIAYTLAWDARKRSNVLGKDVGKTFLICGALTTFLWFLYPIAWGLCEGGNVIAVDSEAVFYGILDLLAKPVFGALLIWGHKDIDPSRLGLNMHDYTAEDAVHQEKNRARGNREATDGVHQTDGTHQTDGVHTNGNNSSV